jgi:hypothetical protein
LFFLLFIFPFLNIFFQIRENFKSEQILNWSRFQIFVRFWNLLRLIFCPVSKLI